MSIDVRRAGDRFVTEDGGRSTRHSFAFGRHYDPENLGFASLVALNDETLPPGTGYADHPHADVEIVTWVLEGALRHTGADGASGVLLPGDVQRISAGTGIVHAETTEPGVRTRFLQTWLRPDAPGGLPSYGIARGAATGGGLVEVVGPDGVLAVGTSGAQLLLADTATDRLVLPEAPRLHLFVVSGRVVLDDDELADGDAARMTDQGGRTLEVVEPGAVAVWAFAT
ncbi:MAG: hypothetical protein JWP74_121 [Marmoricola sp.]|nr:hypothetical protein [Marmoricola sp.]